MKLTQKGFRAWLESKHPQTVVGRSFEGRTCPIAKYLKDSGANSPSVGRLSFTINYTTTNWQLDLPRWATEFVGRVDGIGKHKPVTASRALKILDGK